MKVNYKELQMEFVENEGTLAGEFFSKVLEADRLLPAVPVKSAEIKNFPFTEEEIYRQQNEHKNQIAEKDKTIADLQNRLAQATNNITKLKTEVNNLKVAQVQNTAPVVANQKKDWERQEELEEAYTTIKNKTAEIISLQAKIKELENKPNEYSSAINDQLLKNGLITEKEHDQALDRVTMGRNVHTYWDEFTTYVDNYMPAPLLVTEFGTFNVVNCTPHNVTLQSGKSGTITISPSEICTRLEMDQKEVELEGSDLSLVVESKGKLINVPARAPKTLYIVSRIVFDVSVDREDFICPNVIKARKDGNQVISVPNFICRKELIIKSREEMNK